ncbi:MAG: hypothetical protein QOH77_1649, partial [Actinomycetota bacterium]|nr:hypothetical protein [Actinomycetota bacterium]
MHRDEHGDAGGGLPLVEDPDVR